MKRFAWVRGSEFEIRTSETRVPVLARCLALGKYLKLLAPTTSTGADGTCSSSALVQTRSSLKEMLEVKLIRGMNETDHPTFT